MKKLRFLELFIAIVHIADSASFFQNKQLWHKKVDICPTGILGFK